MSREPNRFLTNIGRMNVVFAAMMRRWRLSGKPVSEARWNYELR